jgi:hypothetical protein
MSQVIFRSGEGRYPQEQSTLTSEIPASPGRHGWNSGSAPTGKKRASHTPKLDAHLMVAGDFSYPSRESKAGWRPCHSDEEVGSPAGMDSARLEVVGHWHNVQYAGPWQIAVVRQGI